MSVHHPGKGPPYAYYDGTALYYTPVHIEPRGVPVLTMPPPTRFRLTHVGILFAGGSVPADTWTHPPTESKYPPAGGSICNSGVSFVSVYERPWGGYHNMPKVRPGLCPCYPVPWGDDYKLRGSVGVLQ